MESCCFVYMTYTHIYFVVAFTSLLFFEFGLQHLAHCIIGDFFMLSSLFLHNSNFLDYVSAKKNFMSEKLPNCSQG